MEMMVIGNRMVFSSDVRTAVYDEKLDKTRVVVDSYEGRVPMFLEGNQLVKLKDAVNDANKSGNLHMINNYNPVD